jgi:hypothetical protein
MAFAHDHEPINTEFAAPFATGAGNFQFGYQYFRAADQLAPITFEYGFAPRQQVSIALPIVSRPGDGGGVVGAGNLEVEYRLLVAGANERKFALSLNPGLMFPVGDKQVAERSWAGGGALHLDTHLVDGIWTHTNVGYEAHFANIGEEREKHLHYNSAVMWEASKHFQPVFEFVGAHEFTSATTVHFVVPEIIFAPNHHWEIKAGLPLGVSSSAPDVGVQLQLTWKFGKQGRQ